MEIKEELKNVELELAEIKEISHREDQKEIELITTERQNLNLNKSSDQNLVKGKTNSSYEAESEPKPVSVFKLFFSLSSKSDILLMILALIGSLAAGLSMPLLSSLYGSTLSTLGAGQALNPNPIGLQKTVGDIVRNFLIVGASMFLSYFMMSTFWTWVSIRQMQKLKEFYFKELLKQEQGWFDSSNAYEISTKVQAQIKQVEGGMGEKIGNILMSLSQVITGLVIALNTNWKLTLVILCTSPLIIMTVIILVKKMKVGALISRKSYEKAGGVAEEVLYNIKTVASFMNIDFEVKRFEKYIEDCKNQGIKNGFKLGMGMGLVFSFLFFYLLHCSYLWK
jgi:ABC-type multidrug transport system fused ATPase/permease subunit